MGLASVKIASPGRDLAGLIAIGPVQAIRALTANRNGACESQGSGPAGRRLSGQKPSAKAAAIAESATSTTFGPAVKTRAARIVFAG